MAKFENNSGVYESKYAARQRKARENAEKEIAAPMPKKGNDYDNDSRPQRRYDNGKTVKKGLPDVSKRYPDHISGIAALIKNNAEIRRFTALGILNYLIQKGVIKNTKDKFVQFKWNKFAVKADGLMTEYFYTEPFFMNALIASFASFSASAQMIIDRFLDIELNTNYNEIFDEKEVKRIINENIEHQKEIINSSDYETPVEANED